MGVCSSFCSTAGVICLNKMRASKVARSTLRPWSAMPRSSAVGTQEWPVSSFL